MIAHPSQRRFALDFEHLLISSIIADSDPAVIAWTTGEDAGQWRIEVYLQSPNRHCGLTVSVQVTVPAFDAELGMDVETYALVAGSGIIESSHCNTPDTDSRMHYRSRGR